MLTINYVLHVVSNRSSHMALVRFFSAASNYGFTFFHYRNIPSLTELLFERCIAFSTEPNGSIALALYLIYPFYMKTSSLGFIFGTIKSQQRIYCSFLPLAFHPSIHSCSISNSSLSVFDWPIYTSICFLRTSEVYKNFQLFRILLTSSLLYDQQTFKRRPSTRGSSGYSLQVIFSRQTHKHFP